jgi:gamma-glutamylcyclotransferase (GGCT)/AIG2-like uncharacterized protein YtfP
MAPRALDHPIAVYGLLRPGQSGYRQFRLTMRTRNLGPCTIQGLLYDAGGYPGLVAGEGKVAADLLGLADPRLLAELDAFEGFNPDQPKTSAYIRQLIEVGTRTGPVTAWTYLYNQPVRGLARIPSGNWLGRRRG